MDSYNMVLVQSQSKGVRSSRGAPGRCAQPVSRGAHPFGTLGCLIGPDINGFEVSKCLSYQGAELLLYSAFALPDWC